MGALSALQRAETLAALLRHHGDKTAAARQLGIAPRTMRDRAVAIGWGGQYEEAYIPDIDDLPHKAPIEADDYQQEPVHDEDKIHTVLAIGDAHEKPGRSKERFTWMGRMAAERAPSAVVSIGDWASFDSLSSHEIPGSAADADRPPFFEELGSLDESLSVFHREIPPSIPVFHTHGNHEYRTVRAANRQPKLNADMPIRLEQVFARYGWQTRPFGEFLDLYGVDFVHIPLSIMGREMGGKNVEQAVARETLRSTVFGHTHRYNFHTACKVGQNRSIQIVNLGTSLPHGVVEKYAKMSTTGWSYGVVLLRIQGGQILSAKHYDMLELESLYS